MRQWATRKKCNLRLDNFLPHIIIYVVEVRLIKGKIDHQTFFKKYGTSAIKTIFLGDDRRSTIIHGDFYVIKISKQVLQNNFKMI